MSGSYLERLRKSSRNHSDGEIISGAVSHGSLKPYLYSGIGGVADYLAIAEDQTSIFNLATETIKSKIPYIVIGAGSNLLISDIGYPGLAIINRSKQLLKLDENRLLVEGGVSTQELVNKMVEFGLSGLEFLSGIPGTIGGAVVTHARSDINMFKPFIIESLWLVVENNEVKTRVVAKDEYLNFIAQPSVDTLTANRPILLNLKLFLRRAMPEEIMKKLSIIRDQKKAASLLAVTGYEKPQRRLGYIFNQPLTLDLIKEKVFRQFFNGKIRLDKKDPNIIIIDALDATSLDVAGFIEKLRCEINRYSSRHYGYRLEFLGQFPDGDE